MCFFVSNFFVFCLKIGIFVKDERKRKENEVCKMAIVYSVEIGDPIEKNIKGNPHIYFTSINEALQDALYSVEKLEELYGLEFIFSENEPIEAGNKERSLQILKGYVAGVNEPLTIQLNIEEYHMKKELTEPNIPTSNLSEHQMTFISELEGLLNRADEDDGLFYQ